MRMVKERSIGYTVVYVSKFEGIARSHCRSVVDQLRVFAEVAPTRTPKPVVAPSLGVLMPRAKRLNGGVRCSCGRKPSASK